MEDDNSRVAWDGPLIVATGHFSASASEIVAAALQDYGRAVVVGDSATHGKGTVQTLAPLSRLFGRLSLSANAGNLKYTISKFYRIAGGTTQKYGVTPDIALPSALDFMELGESHLPNCLPADRTTPADYKRLDLVQPYLATLRERSANRVAASRDYAFVLEDIEEVKKRKADPSVSLNEAKRVTEKKEKKDRDEARKKERRALEAVPPMVRELTLEAVAKGEAPKVVTAKPKDPAEDTKDKDKDEDEEDSVVTDEDERRLEPQLRETLNVLGDYLELMSAKGDSLSSDVRAAVPLKN
jgi:carboxyl-terminal processing protease